MREPLRPALGVRERANRKNRPKASIELNHGAGATKRSEIYPQECWQAPDANAPRGGRTIRAHAGLERSVDLASAPRFCPTPASSGGVGLAASGSPGSCSWMIETLVPRSLLAAFWAATG